MPNIAILDLDIGEEFMFDHGRMVEIPENPRTKDWPKFDPDPRNCDGAGQRTCLERGRHSWFNHAQDSYQRGSLSDNYPPGFDRSLDA